jgi:hypothetical protein
LTFGNLASGVRLSPQPPASTPDCLDRTMHETQGALKNEEGKFFHSLEII